MDGLDFARNVLGVCAAAALLADCGGSQPQIRGPGTTPQDAVFLPLPPVSSHNLRSKSRMPRKEKNEDLLYVTGNSNNTVSIYDLDTPGFPEVAAITDEVSSPGGVAVDRHGSVYVANETGTVTIYPPGKTSPSLTLSKDLEAPQSVTVDANDNVYVCSRGSYPSIVVYPPGESTPSAVITDALIQSPNQIQFDATGNLYYADSDAGVSEMLAGSQNMTSLHLHGLQSLRGLALDKYGNLYVGTYGNHLDGAREYLYGDQKPVRTLRDSEGSDLYASGVVKHQQYIFLPDSYNDTVRAFKPDARIPEFVINTASAESSVGVAFKPAGVP